MRWGEARRARRVPTRRHRHRSKAAPKGRSVPARARTTSARRQGPNSTPAVSLAASASSPRRAPPALPKAPPRGGGASPPPLIARTWRLLKTSAAARRLGTIDVARRPGRAACRSRPERSQNSELIASAGRAVLTVADERDEARRRPQPRRAATDAQARGDRAQAVGGDRAVTNVADGTKPPWRDSARRSRKPRSTTDRRNIT